MTNRKMSREEYLDLLDSYESKEKQFRKHVSLQEYHKSEPLRKECNKIWKEIQKYRKENDIHG